MATIICSHCSATLTIEGPPPNFCPSCGKTLRIEGDVTRTGGLPSTIMQTPDERPAAFGRYIVLKSLGGGGFGSVFQARDPQLDRLVAIKVPKPGPGTTPHALERFAREGRNAARLKNPGIVVVHDVVERDGKLPFIVCEYIEGETLADRIRNKKDPITFRQAAEIVQDVALSLQYAHDHQTIHRDIKPSNIMICPDGKPRLMDFGLAKRDVDITITHPNAVLGTPAYMSPEQARGESDEKVDARSDVYSLGTVLYHVLTGEMPFHGEARAVIRQVNEDEPKAPRKLRSEIPRDLEVICQKAMRKAPKDRYQTAKALAEDLDSWLKDIPIKARPATRWERTQSWCRRYPAAAGLIATVALFLLALAGGGGVMAAVQANARRNAENAQKEIEGALAKNQVLLARAYGERGERHYRVAELSDQYAPISALPWLLEAMKVDEKNSERLLADRIRLQVLLDSTPRVERMWFFKGVVNAAGISPKRDLFFMAGTNGNVNIWKTEGRIPPIVLSHPVSVLGAAFHPDGLRLATVAIDGLRIWEIASSKCLIGPVPLRNSLIRTAPSERWSMAFSRSGRFLFTYSLAGDNQLWNIESGQTTGRKIGSGAVSTAEFADSDRRLVLNLNGSTRVYDVLTGTEKLALEGGGRSIPRGKTKPG